MVKAGNDPRQQQRGVIRRNGREHVAEGKNRHQKDQRVSARAVGEQQRHQRRANHYADGIGANQHSRRRNRNVNAFSDNR